ncbi:MAG: metal ABC transporter substrate-binding protein, partial [Rhodobacteraceae bacterium]|nr:metal ABC transporter substrate-binding protein [Paracoccaceae bacterium]
AWLDPANARAWLALIRDRLAQADPDHAPLYRQNAEATDQALAALEGELQTILAPAAGKPLIMGHNAYGYLARRFGLTIAATIEAGDAAEPGAAHISALTALLAAHKVTCLFPEAGQDPKRAALLVEGTTTRLGGALDPEGISLTPGPGLYGDLMRRLAHTIADCAAQG